MDPLKRLCEGALALTVVAASGAVFAQVICRYVLNDPSTWLDEFAVLAFAWMIMIGAAVVQRDDAHMQIDSFVRPLPAAWQTFCYVVRFVCIAATVIVLFWQGWLLAKRDVLHRISGDGNLARFSVRHFAGLHAADPLLSRPQSREGLAADEARRKGLR